VQAQQLRRRRAREAPLVEPPPQRQRRQPRNDSAEVRGLSPEPNALPLARPFIPAADRRQDASPPQGRFAAGRLIEQGSDYETFVLFLESAYQNLTGLSLPEARDKAAPEPTGPDEGHLKCQLCDAYVRAEKRQDDCW